MCEQRLQVAPGLCHAVHVSMCQTNVLSLLCLHSPVIARCYDIQVARRPSSQTGRTTHPFEAEFCLALLCLQHLAEAESHWIVVSTAPFVLCM